MGWLTYHDEDLGLDLELLSQRFELRLRTRNEHKVESLCGELLGILLAQSVGCTSHNSPRSGTAILAEVGAAEDEQVEEQLHIAQSTPGYVQGADSSESQLDRLRDALYVVHLSDIVLTMVLYCQVQSGGRSSGSQEFKKIRARVNKLWGTTVKVPVHVELRPPVIEELGSLIGSSS